MTKLIQKARLRIPLGLYSIDLLLTALPRSKDVVLTDKTENRLKLPPPSCSEIECIENILLFYSSKYAKIHIQRWRLLTCIIVWITYLRSKALGCNHVGYKGPAFCSANVKFIKEKAARIYLFGKYVKFITFNK